MRNQALGEQPNNNKNDRDLCTFERMKLLFDRIRVPNQAEGVIWECNLCDDTTDTKENYGTT